jgi:ABC-type antimicrobial peptide transport system permease subunit
MKLYRTIRAALRALRRNVMRSILTTLGIIIGIAAVIAMMEIGKGSSSAIRQTIASMGANNLLVMPGTAASGGVSFGAGSILTLTPQDADAILKECPSVRAAAPIVRARTQVIFGDHNWVPLYIYGTTPAFLNVRDWNNLAEGRPFTETEVRDGAAVCLVGQTLVRQLFQGESPIGKDVRLQHISFQVVGVLSRKGANMMGMDQDDIVIAPWTAIKYRVTGSSVSSVNQSNTSAESSQQVNSPNQIYPGSQGNLYPVPSATQAADTPVTARFANVDQILGAAGNAGEIPAAIKEVTTLLRERHRIQENEPDDFSVRDMTEMSNALSSTTTLMTNLLLCVAFISLVVGGVGIMNIMLVSVTERTREIGLRMSVGARARDILRQFLIEAVLLCLAGGVLGILGGQGSSYLVAQILKWPTELSVAAIVAAVAVSAGVGIVFGYYPAWKASRLDPIDALRYE